ncbi:exported hypothetical protein [uncultured Desulfobacterium sp.]|uniref:Outer membrane porin, OprD family n=1 Tax=uncultured Desulfobacterium sp. TaxID=201089 RepID=A0A445MYG2_9BACT|nr:exported hypothetical protein [uncultured Desulfobacterium sp.]
MKEFWRKNKFIGIIMAVTLSVTGNAFAADTITDTFKNGNFNGEAKIWYQSDDNDANKHIFDTENSWFDAGLRFSYSTDTYKGLSVGATFYAVDDLGAYENFANRSMLNVEHSDTGAWLGEAYLNYTVANTSAKAGRQNILSPLVNSDDWPIFPNNFEAFLIKNSDIPDTTLIGGYVWKERWMKSDDQEFNDFHNDVLMVGVINKSISNSELSGYFYEADDDDKTIKESDDNTIAAYVEAKTKFKMLNLGAQCMRIDPDSNGDKPTDAVGVKVNTKLWLLDMTASFVHVTDGARLAAKLSDNSIKTPLYTYTIGADGDVAGRPDSNSYKFSVTVSPIDQLSLTTAYAYYSMDDTKYYADIVDGDCSEADFEIKYTGIKNTTIWAALWYADHEGIGVYNGVNNEDMITFRCWASYMF